LSDTIYYGYTDAVNWHRFLLRFGEIYIYKLWFTKGIV